MSHKAKQSNSNDFNTFAKNVYRYADAIGLSGWDIITVHDELDDDKIATCQYDIESMHAVIIFNTNAVLTGNSETTLKRIALHEVQHIAQARISYIARTGQIGDEEVNLTSAKHELINMTINLVDALSDEFK